MTGKTAESLEAEIAVLEANTAFYRAFSQGDLAAMSALWAARAPSACLHPGMAALVGRRAILSSWEEILREMGGTEMECRNPRVHLLGDVAFVLCLEAGADQPAHLAATNIFVREGANWRMVHHHAGPLSRPVRKAAPERTSN